ncbi:hypothetical protein [Bacillus badius]|uniref:DUF4901 domain-containing protein n=1 Tax=Bacillus badius TaxID=1455 RepID=A0ABR5AZT6_BACBA|nr:hypothetical protein [Bacillus badius]KIL80145.1 hypothetical protein SD77_2599 [Bacillus badius]KZR60044.1 hypothetical protein A3781_07520 [Bacillus badius]MED4718525.1 hypothetical protein [Bacillus badius]
MDKRIKDLIDFTREKYGLVEYYLHTWNIHRHPTVFNDTVYTLSMEWFPNSMKNWDDQDLNPEGTASIEIDIHSRKASSVIFVGGISYAHEKAFDLSHKEKIIEWIEQETGLTYEKEFEFWKEEEREIYFKACIDGMAVAPSGSIELKLDQDGKLILFSVIGQFPSPAFIMEATYELSFEQIEGLAKEQLKLIEFPVMEEERLVHAFAIEEIYIKNDCFSTLPFEQFVYEKSLLQIDQVIEWDLQIQQPFHRKELAFVEHITPEQAFRCEAHPDLQPITGEEINQCISAIQQFFSQEYPNDSGKWLLKSLHREKGYIQAAFQIKEQKERVFKRKIRLFIDSKTYEVLNYMDNRPFLDIYQDFKESDQIKVAKEEAFEKLKDFIELTLCYVYDFEQGSYVLCGKLDCHYAVKADSGEVIELSDL